MKLYISGKITGLSLEDALARFKASEHFVRSCGHEPVNPMSKESEQRGLTWEQYMCEDIAILFECDGIYLLNNWQESNGARIEKAICEILDKPVFYQGSAL